MATKKVNPKVKVDVVLEGIRGKSPMEICRKFRISQGEFSQWHQQFLANAWKAFDAGADRGPAMGGGGGDGEEEIIIKRGGKGHGGHHGGSWKVAYADFVTAMMAFFLLMWLTSVLTEVQKTGVADYFENYRVFKEQGATPLYETIMTTKQADPGKGENKVGYMEELKQELKKKVEGKYQAVSDQIIVEMTEDGFRVQLVDKEGNPMFASGSSNLNEWAKDVIQVVAETVKDLPNKIAIEGHTDSVPFASGKLSNWELSSQRASAARQQFEKSGIDPNRFNRIVGYADTELFLKGDPTNSKNRRINIILLKEGVQDKAP